MRKKLGYNEEDEVKEVLPLPNLDSEVLRNTVQQTMAITMLPMY